MRAIISALAVTLALGFGGGVVEAKAKPKKKAAKKQEALPKVATKETTVAIEKLMGIFKWGMTSQQVMNQLEKDVRAEMEPVIKNTADPLAQDRVRREMMEKLKEIKQRYTKFEGKATPWDVSLVDKEFAHKNNESMVHVFTKKDRRFFFFHNDKLWKLYIAFNSDLYEGKSFEDFAGAMETRFGRAQRKFAVTLKGEQKMSHLSWPPSPTTILRAIDETGFYGNFCLVLTDKNELPVVRSGRKVNSPKREYSDPLIDAVTKDGGTEGTGTGGGEDAAPSDSGSSGKGKKGKGIVKTDDEPTKPEKKKKVNEKNPLDGLDI